MSDNENLVDAGWMVPALIFAKALGNILEENQGIVVDLNENTKIVGYEELTKVIVYKKEEQIHIGPCEEDIEEGTVLQIGTQSEEEN
jgi:hypothetical protein